MTASGIPTAIPTIGPMPSLALGVAVAIAGPTVELVVGVAVILVEVTDASEVDGIAVEYVAFE